MKKLNMSFVALLLGALIAVTQSSFRTVKLDSVAWGKYTGATGGGLVNGQWYQADSPPSGYTAGCDDAITVCSYNFSYDPNTDDGANPDSIHQDDGRFTLTN